VTRDLVNARVSIRAGCRIVKSGKAKFLIENGCARLASEDPEIRWDNDEDPGSDPWIVDVFAIDFDGPWITSPQTLDPVIWIHPGDSIHITFPSYGVRVYPRHTA
jgi:hypothetical protein